MRRLVRALLAVFVVPAALGGCIVASDPDFQGQDECVPFFLTHEAAPSTSEIIVQSAADDPTTFRASVPLRSCALTLEYRVRVFVDNALVSDNAIPPSEQEVREVSLLVDLTEASSSGCHRVEAYASTNFAGGLRTPLRAGDVTKITWWLADNTSMSIGSCATQ